MHQRVFRFLASAVIAIGLPLGVVTAAATANAATPHVSNLRCTTGHSGPDGWATCTGSGDWELSLYCNFPSPSPINNSEIFQNGGTITSRASCWFGASFSGWRLSSSDQLLSLSRPSAVTVPSAHHTAGRPPVPSE